MKTITVITPSNIEVEYHLAGAGSRTAAYIIDFILQYTIIIFFILVVLLGVDYRIFGNEIPSGIALGVSLVFWFTMHVGYFIVCEMIFNGQTIGKKIFSLRVIRDNGMPLGFGQSVVRGLLRTFVDGLSVGLFVIIFSNNHKRVGDMAAGTIVIIEHREEFVSHTVPHWPDFLPDPFTLTPEERRLAEEWLARRDEMPDGGASAGEKLLAYLNRGRQPDPQPEAQPDPQPDNPIPHENHTEQPDPPTL